MFPTIPRLQERPYVREGKEWYCPRHQFWADLSATCQSIPENTSLDRALSHPVWEGEEEASEQENCFSRLEWGHL